MKKKQKNNIFISEERNYISNQNIKKRNISKNNSYCNNIFLIFLTGLLISIFFYILNINKNIKAIKEIFPKIEKEDNLKYQNKDNINIDKQSLDSNKPPLDTIDLNILDPIISKVNGKIELFPEEMKFFHGILRKVKPKKIVEIGVSAGGSSALILNAIKDIEGAKLYSIDKSVTWYRDKTRNT